jgi:dTDP-glucose 4,6-dehydratase
MRYFVTGGAGFIGSNFIHSVLSDPNNEVINYDKLTYAGNLDNLKDVDCGRYTFIKADITNHVALSSSLSKHTPDVLVSFAAESHVDNSLVSATEFIDTNVMGAEVVLRCSRDLGVKLIHISTDEVYGSLVALEASESSKFDPNSPYSVSKAAGDMMCKAHYVSFGTPVIVMRGSNAYGPRQHPEKLIPKSITNLLSDETIGVYGKGLNVREWIYVEDFCSGILTAIEKGEVGQAYNVGGGAVNRVANNKIAKSLCRGLEKSPEAYIEYVRDRAGHDMRYALDSSKLRDLGWAPKHNLDSGIDKTIEWYRKNEWWWKPLLNK